MAVPLVVSGYTWATVGGSTARRCSVARDVATGTLGAGSDFGMLGAAEKRPIELP